MAKTMAALYAPPDIEEAYAAWRATCGPAAVAALLGRPIMACRDLFDGFKGYCNVTQLKRALERAGCTWTETGPRFPPEDARRAYRKAPISGLAFLQIDGPWTAPGVPVRAAYPHCHIVATALPSDAVAPDLGRMVYDINASDWLPVGVWVRDVVPRLIAAHRRSNGKWWCRAGLEVVRGATGR